MNNRFLKPYIVSSVTHVLVSDSSCSIFSEFEAKPVCDKKVGIFLLFRGKKKKQTNKKH